MRWILRMVVVLAVCAAPLTAGADCPGQCEKTCRNGPDSDYASCMDCCLAGCTPWPDPVPLPPNDPPLPPDVPQAPQPPPEPDSMRGSPDAAVGTSPVGRVEG